ncbi:MAG: TonB-dependent receptor, partial [Pseudomonadota bacterium]
ALGGGNFSGNRFPYSPEWTGAIGIDYAVTDRLRVALDASYTDSSNWNAGNQPENESDDRFLLNAQVTYEFDHLTLAIYGRNLLDDDYITWRLGTDPNNVFIRTGEPIAVGAYVQYEF